MLRDHSPTHRSVRILFDNDKTLHARKLQLVVLAIGVEQNFYDFDTIRYAMFIVSSKADISA